MPRRSVCSFFHVPSMLFRSLSASDKHAAGPFCSRETVACRDRIVVSTLRCGCSKSGSRQTFAVGLLFATSSFSWILCLKLGGVLFCPPAAKGAGGSQPGVVVAERLRRWTRNPLGSPRAGSNPADYGWRLPSHFSFLCR